MKRCGIQNGHLPCYFSCEVTTFFDNVFFIYTSPCDQTKIIPNFGNQFDMELNISNLLIFTLSNTPEKSYYYNIL